jgi:hypothetical protein
MKNEQNSNLYYKLTKMTSQREEISAAIDTDINKYREQFKNRIEKKLTDLNKTNADKYGKYLDVESVSVFSSDGHRKCRAMRKMHRDYIDNFEVRYTEYPNPHENPFTNIFKKCKLSIVLED